MAILRFVIVMLVLVAGCYAPDLDDCAVTCTTDAECAGDQVCTPQGYCAGAVTACENTGAVDGAVAPMIDLRVTVMGEGKVAVAGGSECDPAGGHMGDSCTLKVPAGPLTIEAIPARADRPFERWTTLVCAGQDKTCEVTLTINTNVGAKFK